MARDLVFKLNGSDQVLVARLLWKQPKMRGACPICGQVPEARSLSEDAVVFYNGCKHLVVKGFSGEETPGRVLSSPRSWQGDESHPWPWVEGWPSTKYYFVEFADEVWVAESADGTPEASLLRDAFSKVYAEMRPLGSVFDSRPNRKDVKDSLGWEVGKWAAIPD